MAIFTARNAGIAFMVVGILMILGGVLTLIIPFAKVAGFEDYDLVYFIILAVGEFISGALYFIYGKRANDGTIYRKVDILAYFVKVVGVTAIISGVCSTAASMYPSLDIGTFFAGAISSIVIGLILIVCAMKINDNKKTFFDKVIWTVLLIAFMSLFLISLLEVIGVDNVVAGAVGVLTYVYMVILLFDPDVEMAMGIRAEDNPL